MQYRGICAERRLGDEIVISEPIATRGERLVLTRAPIVGQATRGQRRSQAESLGIAEIDADERIVASSLFDLDDFDCRLSKNSTPGTSPARPAPTRTRGRSSQGSTPR